MAYVTTQHGRTDNIVPLPSGLIAQIKSFGIHLSKLIDQQVCVHQLCTWGFDSPLIKLLIGNKKYVYLTICTIERSELQDREP